MIVKFKNWWRGKLIPTDPDIAHTATQLGIRLGCCYNPPLIAKLLNPLVNFWIRNWKFIISTLVFIVISAFGIAASLFIHYDKQQVEKPSNNIEKNQPNRIHKL